MSTSTPQNLIDLLDRIADEVDRSYLGVRQTDMARWAKLVAGYAWLKDERIGRKRADAGRPLSNDTFGITLISPGKGEHHVPFFAVSVARDNPIGGNERRKPPLDYGLVEDQIWVYPVPPFQPPAPIPEPPSPPIPPRDLGPILTSLSEDVRALRAGQETIIARLTGIESASGRQEAILVRMMEEAGQADTVFARRFLEIQERLGILLDIINELRYPRYRGKILGMTIVLTPEP